MATDYKAKLVELRQRLQKIYPEATIEQDIDLSGNSVFLTNIPGVQLIESMNLNALEITVGNLEQKAKAKTRGL